MARKLFVLAGPREKGLDSAPAISRARARVRHLRAITFALWRHAAFRHLLTTLIAWAGEQIFADSLRCKRCSAAFKVCRSPRALRPNADGTMSNSQRRGVPYGSTTSSSIPSWVRSVRTIARVALTLLLRIDRHHPWWLLVFLRRFSPTSSTDCVPYSRKIVSGGRFRLAEMAYAAGRCRGWIARRSVGATDGSSTDSPATANCQQ